MLRNSDLPKSSQVSLAKSVLNEFKKVYSALLATGNTNVFFFIKIFWKLLIIIKDCLIDR